ncbi:DegV family protein [uncultured Slackia sp.]|uniref:DegV family protein n=1 Tax=uncultured Slackia sp. TaxID=665903 RepID=UPI0026E0433C|nr:DegV family protein [uncultured Slackia sp.]
MTARCNLIVDSCCDLPFDVVDRDGVYLIEFPFLFGEEEHLDDLGRSMSAHDFFERMRAGEQPTTAQVSIPAFTQAFEEAAQNGVPTVYLSFSSGLSGSYDVSTIVYDQVKERYPDMELHIVDTKLASVAEALLVYEAIRQRESGLTAAELAAWASEARYFVNALFMVDDLESLRRGGRIPDSVAYAGAKLDVKPLLTIGTDGKLSLKGVARGRKKAIKQLVEYYFERRDESGFSQCVVTGHADCPKDMERLHDAVTKQDESVLFMDSAIGPVIGSHVGPDMLAIVFWGKDRREDLSVADRIARKVKGA